MKMVNTQLLSARSLGIAFLLTILLLLIALPLHWRAQGQSGNPVTIVSAANYVALVTPDAIATAFGAKLATRTVSVTSLPLPTTLAGTTVKVNGTLAPLFFVSPTQINFLIPASTPAGAANIAITAEDGTLSSGTVQVNEAAPAIFTMNSSSKGLPAALLLRVKADGTLSYEKMADFNQTTSTFVPIPIKFGPESEADFLVLYLCGVRRAALETVRVMIGGSEMMATYAGAADSLVGLDQINVELPRSLGGRGRVSVQVLVGNAVSNTVEIEIDGTHGRATTTTTVAASASTAVYGQAMTFTAQVHPAAGSGSPGGTVMFRDGAIRLGTATLNAGQATFTPQAPLSAGSHRITADYGGDNNFAGSFGLLSSALTIHKAQAVLALTSSANPILRTQDLTLMASVTAAAPSTAIPTGIIQFKDAGENLGTPVTIINGSANFNFGRFRSGAHAITAEYYGDPNFLPPSAAAGFAQTVNNPDLRASSFIRSQTLYAGDEVTIVGSGFSSDPAEHEVQVVDDDGNRTNAQVLSVSDDQLRIRVPFGAGSGSVRVVSQQRESVCPERLPVTSSLSGFVQEAVRQPDGSYLRRAIAGVTINVISIANIPPSVTNADGSFILKFPPTLTAAQLQRVDFMVSGETAPGMLPYPNLQLSDRVRPNRDNQFRGRTSVTGEFLANIIELRTVGTATVAAVAPNTRTNKSVSVAAPASPDEAQGSVTSGQVTFDTGNSTVTFPSGSTGPLRLAVLDPGRTPSNLPTGYFSSTIAQITPFGATLNPGGKLIFPNGDGLTAGASVRVFRFDQTTGSPTLGTFIDIGSATVSADGTKIETAANAVTQASYYFVSPQWPAATVASRVVDTNGRPVRRAVVNVRGQAVFTDNNGDYTLSNIPVITPAATNDRITLEGSFVRPDVRVDRTQSASTIVSANTSATPPNLVFPAPPVNRPPVITAPSSLLITENQLRDFNFLVNDPENQTLTVTLTAPPFVTLLNQGGGQYAMRIAPVTNTAGSYTITIRASDSDGATSQQAVALLVQASTNTRPTVNYFTTTTNEDVSTSITLTASDPNNRPLSYTVVSNPTHGSLSGTEPNLTYTPALNYNGVDSFSFKANNGTTESAVAVVSIFVKPVNDAPVLSVPSPLTAQTGQSISFTISAVDPDLGQLRFRQWTCQRGLH